MNLSPEKLVLVGIIALVVLGPNRLPQAARTAGRLLAEFRRVSANVQNEVSDAIGAPRDSLHQAIGEFGLTDVRTSLRRGVNEAVNGVRAPFTDPGAVSPDVATTGTGATGTVTPGRGGAGPASTGPGVGAAPPVPDDPGLN